MPVDGIYMSEAESKKKCLCRVDATYYPCHSKAISSSFHRVRSLVFVEIAVRNFVFGTITVSWRSVDGRQAKTQRHSEVFSFVSAILTKCQ